MGFALAYVFLWEGLLAIFLDGIRYLRIRRHTLGILTVFMKKPSQASGIGP